MDILKDKQYKDYSSISRYNNFPFYYHAKDKNYIYGLTNQLSENIEVVDHRVTNLDTLDSLALKYYNRPDLFWVIADYNKIQDPYIDLNKFFKVIKIPSLGSLRYKE